MPTTPDLNTIARRNIALTTAHHRRTSRDRLRSLALRGLARRPVKMQPGDPETFLLVRPDHLGDMLLTMPAILALRAARPGATLIALVGPWARDVAAAYDVFDDIRLLDFPGFTRRYQQTSAAPYRLAWEAAQELRQLNVGTAIIFRPDHWWGALLAQWSGIPRRVGYALPDVRAFLSEPLPLTAAHAVTQGLDLVHAWTGPLDPAQVKLVYPVGEAARVELRQMLGARGLDAAAPYAAIHPGSGTAIKQWGAAQWATVADALAADWSARIVFTGGPGEVELVAAVAAQMQAAAINLAGETSLGTLAALYAGARAVLGPDSGPLHVAAAVGTPTVTLFGPADPAQFRPWGSPARHAVLTTGIACRPCRILDWPHDDPAYHPCVRNILAETVITAARQVAAVP